MTGPEGSTPEVGSTMTVRDLVLLSQVTLTRTHPVRSHCFLHQVYEKFAACSSVENTVIPVQRDSASPFLAHFPMSAPLSMAIFSMAFHSNVHIYTEMKPTSSNELHQLGISSPSSYSRSHFFTHHPLVQMPIPFCN